MEVQPLFDSAGQHTGFMTIESDITQRKEAENSLRESQNLFKELLNVASDWYWETDEHNRFSNFVATHDTENYRELSQSNLGKRRWEMVGVTPLSADWEAHIAVHERRESFRNFEYRRVLPSGEVRYYAISGSPVIDSFAVFKGYRGTTRDSTEQMRQQVELPHPSRRQQHPAMGRAHVPALRSPGDRRTGSIRAVEQQPAPR